jgi:hypothetical protein
MRSPFIHKASLFAVLAVATSSSAATFTPTVTPPTPEISPTAMVSAGTATALPRSPTFAPSPRPTATRRTALPSASPVTATDVEATPVANPEVEADDVQAREMPSVQALPSVAPVGPVRAFRTPERAGPAPFMAPRGAPPAVADDTQPAEPATESMPPPDRPRVATVTFVAVASSELEGFQLVVIYPRAAGDFVGSGNGVDCRKTGDGRLVANDHDDGTLNLFVASANALTFPLEVVCRFTVGANANLDAGLIAVNVAAVSAGGKGGDPSVLSVSVSARY